MSACPPVSQNPILLHAHDNRSLEPPAAFYCVTDRRYFLGAVAMLNSLRLQGHREPLFICDCGLEDEQRRLLAGHATLVAAPSEAPPWLLKTVAPLRHPAEVMVLIDADMILTRSLDELIAEARGGSVVAFENDSDRFVPEWGELLDLGPLRRRRYLSSGLMALPRGLGEEILALMADRQERVDFDQTFWRRNVRDYPFLYGDQCVLNAILQSSLVEPERIVSLPNRLAPNPPFRGLRLEDRATLRCSYADGTEPYVVHHFTAKPWLERTYDGVYSRMLRRLLTGAGLEVEVPLRHVPLRLRRGPAAWIGRRLIDAREQFRWRVGEPLAARFGALRQAPEER